MKYIPVFM